MPSSSPNAAPPSAAPLPAVRQAALDWLLGRINYERTAFVPYQSRQLKLDRMRQLLTRLGQPDAGLKIIHVAGTKGKGSTSAMIAAMLTAAGYRTGVFSSPHLVNIEERFVVDGQPCTAEELVTLVNRIRPEVAVMDEEAAAEGDSTGGPTYFDITTAIALLHFVERQADAAVLEVGLGGRLDSTNVCLPVVSVITSISFDHTRQLGNTLAAIAREKAGIIKPGVPVICGVTDREPHAVIAAIARDHGCRLIQLGHDYQVVYHPPAESRPERKEIRRQGDNADEQVAPSPQPPLSASISGYGTVDFTYCVPGQEYDFANASLSMHGFHQATNAAIALATIAELRHQGWCISTGAMRTGLECAALPGRVEVWPGDPTVVLDTAHNPASARALIAALGELPPPVRSTLIVSISHDKDVTAIVRELVPHFQRIIITQYQENPRAVPADQLAQLVAAELEHARLVPSAAGQAISAPPPLEKGFKTTPLLPLGVGPGKGHGEDPHDRRCENRRADHAAGDSRPAALRSPHSPSGRAVELLICRPPHEAWQTATATAQPGERICIAGSFFLAAELRPVIFGSQAAENSMPAIRL